MGRVIVSNLASLDGFFEGPDKELNWHVVDAEFLDYAKEMLRHAEALLFGAKTYKMMAAFWPTAPSDGIAEKMNGLPKVVFSTTLEKVEWSHSRLVQGSAEEEVAKLKKEAAKDLVVLGSSDLASSLLEAGLVDEYRVILNPVLLGSGKPLFGAVKERMRLQLVSNRVFGSGVVLLNYRTA